MNAAQSSGVTNTRRPTRDARNSPLRISAYTVDRESDEAWMISATL